jgi:predicted RNase H-like HicB family nuclease
MLKYRVPIEKDGDDVLVPKVPDLPGCANEGKTRQELMKNVKEAIHAYLEALKEHDDPVPIETVQVSGSAKSFAFSLGKDSFGLLNYFIRGLQKVCNITCR